jgi:hypothetical protein
MGKVGTKYGLKDKSVSMNGEASRPCIRRRKPSKNDVAHRKMIQEQVQFPFN